MQSEQYLDMIEYSFSSSPVDKGFYVTAVHWNAETIMWAPNKYLYEGSQKVCADNVFGSTQTNREIQVNEGYNS